MPTSMWLGPFKLVESIAEGGMAEVFRGRMAGESTEIAIKVMTNRLARNDYYREQFRREVQAMAQMNHPAITTVYDLGEVGSAESQASRGRLPEGAPWLAMEFVEGEPLAEFLQPPEWEPLQEVLLQLLDALAHAHADNIIHRDLKPSNIIVSEEDEPLRTKLLDFGIARIVSPDDESDGPETDDHVTGTPNYMAPEQVLGQRRAQGPWTDLYAVGCLVWRLVCGNAPFDDRDSESVLAGHVQDELPDFEPVLAIPDGLQDWLRKMLAKEPEARFRRAADAAYGLLQIAGRETLEPTSEVENRSREDEPTVRTTLLALEESVVEESARSAGGPASGEAFEQADIAGVDGSDRRWTRPPIPTDWRRSRTHDRSIPLRGAGVNLFGLRKIPIVDRESERNRMWEALREVEHESDVRTVVLTGPPGCGKSRLADWLAHRAHETGAANVFRASCSPAGGQGPREGLGPMLARYFRTFGLEEYEIREVLDRRFELLGVSSASAHYDAVGIARMMARAGGAEVSGRDPFSDRDIQNRTLGRLLRRLARERTILLCLDDAQWSNESLALVNYLLGDDRLEAPILVVMTLGWERATMPDDNRALVEAISDSKETRSIGLEPLQEEDQQQLAQQLLGLDPSLAREVARRTGGNPLFAIQLVSDWIERRLLVRTTDGFELRESGEASVPEDIGDLWRLRLDRLFAALPDEDAEESQVRLELAATLGDAISRPEWEHVCKLRGVPLQETSRMLDAMFRRGLANRTRDGWNFAHDLLRKRVLERAENRDRQLAHHAVCAEGLEELYGAQALGVPDRIAQHLLAAGESTAALPYLDRAIWQALDTGRYDRAERLIEKHGEIAGRLSGEEKVRAGMRNRILRGNLNASTGRGAEALEEVESVIDDARERDWGYELASALRVRVRVTKDRGESGAAHRDCLKALGHLDWEEHPIETGQLYRLMGSIERDRGNAESARSSFQKAADWFEEGGFYAHQAAQLTSVGYTWLLEDERDRAGEAFDRALDLARDSGNRSVEAKTWNMLGELARREDDLDEARRCYQKAVDINRGINERFVQIPKGNLALVEIASRNWSKARELLAPVVEALPEFGLDVWTPGLRLGIACADAADGDFNRAFERASQTLEELEGTTIANPDIAWLGELLAELASEVGQLQCARLGWTLALEQWDRLENRQKIEEIEGLLSDRDPDTPPG